MKIVALVTSTWVSFFTFDIESYRVVADMIKVSHMLKLPIHNTSTQRHHNKLSCYSIRETPYDRGVRFEKNKKVPTSGKTAVYFQMQSLGISLHF